MEKNNEDRVSVNLKWFKIRIAKVGYRSIRWKQIFKAKYNKKFKVMDKMKRVSIKLFYNINWY